MIGVRAVRITLPGRSRVGLTSKKTCGLKIGKKSVESHLRVARCSSASASLNACCAERSTVESGRVASWAGVVAAAEETPSVTP
ncbi:hypothetical protein EDE12_102366 [Methylosinus sp. sav-2]|nr:hypothetical protein EDE12_102366 [Methylosinus sp. sav-2]